MLDVGACARLDVLPRRVRRQPHALRPETVEEPLHVPHADECFAHGNGGGATDRRIAWCGFLPQWSRALWCQCDVHAGDRALTLHRAGGSTAIPPFTVSWRVTRYDYRFFTTHTVTPPHYRWRLAHWGGGLGRCCETIGEVLQSYSRATIGSINCFVVITWLWYVLTCVSQVKSYAGS